MKFDKLIDTYNLYLEEYNTLFNATGILKRSTDENEKIKVVQNQLNDMYLKIYNASIEENKFFHGATIDIFKDYIIRLEKSESEKNPDFSIYSFYKSLFIGQHDWLKTPPEHYQHLSPNIIQKFKNTVSKRLEFLKLKMFEMGIEITYSQLTEFSSRKVIFVDNMENQSRYQKSRFGNIEQETLSTLDLSDTKGTEKIIYLERLGILKYLNNLEPFRTSTNSLATVVSAITGIPQTTTQSYLNPIANKGSSQKNNPLKSTKKVENIEKILINLGFNPID